MSRVVLVTGAARGIGAATVRALLARGDRVLAVDELPVPDADGVLGQVADVRDRAALAAAVDRALDRWGRLDAAVAAAAVIAGGRPLWETPEADLDLLWDVDVKGVWHTAAVAVPAMLAGPDPAGCRFVAVASAAGHHGLHHLAAYNAAKHAVVGLVKGLAADLVGTGVTACAVSPGSTRTPMLSATAELYGLSDVEGFAENQLLRRLLDPDEIAATIAFCCGPEAAALNGSVVRADGGFSP
ncbi:mycofactocin-coupled SDR family oxidoreductase [Nocardioides nitrophenolicus]|uniref:mycofactocin-coupled SDR family oxidoreductase n=1 Tax=Nocardioides nitrophenolicus TaxID=60489 RepID=UPI00195A18A4|nr:mycofactocin-coupled SDR family oxidoreductase [Nocardioides nitrophenolicus]MBM7516989.1 SDR family mycofactocin-dependent oxidoreductase [Nocardioides nitrophenolicus]